MVGMGETKSIHAATQPSQPMTSTSSESAAAHAVALSGGGDAMATTTTANAEPTTPWLQVTLAPAPAPVRAVLCTRAGAPHVLSPKALRSGRGELPTLVSVVARELLAE